MKSRNELLEKYIQQWLQILRIWIFLLAAVLPAILEDEGNAMKYPMSVFCCPCPISEKQLRVADIQYESSEYDQLEALTFSC